MTSSDCSGRTTLERRTRRRPSTLPKAMTLATLADETATRTFAARLARELPHGALLLLDGPLGAGKTTLVAALVAALGGPERTSSPTYTLIHEYPTPHGDVIHIDAYRLGDATALEEQGVGRARR